MINPTIAAAIAINNTAPAAKSFVRLIASLYSGETKSARASMDELTASAANTAPITIVTAIHSMRESPNTTPAISTQTAAKQWIQALCSFVINSLIPLKANLKLLALFLPFSIRRRMWNEVYIGIIESFTFLLRIYPGIDFCIPHRVMSQNITNVNYVQTSL